MGCNTSKESVQPAEEEAKEDMKNSGKIYISHKYFPHYYFYLLNLI